MHTAGSGGVADGDEQGSGPGAVGERGRIGGDHQRQARGRKHAARRSDREPRLVHRGCEWEATFGEAWDAHLQDDKLIAARLTVGARLGVAALKGGDDDACRL